jgi:hypothetical protein
MHGIQKLGRSRLRSSVMLLMLGPSPSSRFLKYSNR